MIRASSRNNAATNDPNGPTQGVFVQYDFLFSNNLLSRGVSRPNFGHVRLSSAAWNPLSRASQLKDSAPHRTRVDSRENNLECAIKNLKMKKCGPFSVASSRY